MTEKELVQESILAYENFLLDLNLIKEDLIDLEKLKEESRERSLFFLRKTLLMKKESGEENILQEFYSLLQQAYALIALSEYPDNDLLQLLPDQEIADLSSGISEFFS